jgi:hypothetical protein
LAFITILLHTRVLRRGPLVMNRLPDGDRRARTEAQLPART